MPQIYVDAARRAARRRRGCRTGIAEDDVGRNGAVGEDAAGAVDVVDEGVDRPHPLLEPCRQIGPFAGGEDARDDVERDDPLGRVSRRHRRRRRCRGCGRRLRRPAGGGRARPGHVGEPARAARSPSAPSCGGWFHSSSKARASVTRPSQMPDAASCTKGPRDQSGRRRTGPRGQAGREAPKKTGARCADAGSLPPGRGSSGDLGRLDLVGLAQT